MVSVVPVSGATYVSSIRARLLKRQIVCAVLITLCSCVEPYDPPAIKELVDLLVVDGFINASDSTANVRLSKATALAENSAGAPEANASVVIEDDLGNLVQLQENVFGNYSLSRTSFPFSRKYRLIIQTQNKKQYYSDFINLTRTPAIDSINWKPSIQQRGINVYVNTHDDENQTLYYQWTFEETWEYNSNYPSVFRLQGGVVLEVKEIPYRCWMSEPSTEILVGSSSQLSADVIKEFRLLSLPIPSLKISNRYSILVKQMALTKDAYDFYLQLKKSTESLGGLFDPMPSQVLGNLHSSNPDEPVLGYFSGGEVSEKRTFIRFSELPPDLTEQPKFNCPIDTVTLAELGMTPDMLLINSYGSPAILGYLTSPNRNCMDCRDEGGTLVRPDFW
jgi:hypothetical protein